MGGGSIDEPSLLPFHPFTQSHPPPLPSHSIQSPDFRTLIHSHGIKTFIYVSPPAWSRVEWRKQTCTRWWRDGKVRNRWMNIIVEGKPVGRKKRETVGRLGTMVVPKIKRDRWNWKQDLPYPAGDSCVDHSRFLLVTKSTFHKFDLYASQLWFPIPLGLACARVIYDEE